MKRNRCSGKRRQWYYRPPLFFESEEQIVKNAMLTHLQVLLHLIFSAADNAE